MAHCLAISLTSNSKVRFQDLRIASAPFHIREVAFERMV